MNEVTDVLRDRLGEPQGLQRMVIVSIGIHAAVVTTLALGPNRIGKQIGPPPVVMTISLGGSGGPANGGMTALGARPVQVQTPPLEAPKREAVRPPAAKAPEMTIPTKSARSTRTGSPDVKQAPDEARGKTPTRGKETSAGSAVAETGARGQGFGLSTGGGQGFGATLDVGDFCCPDYIQTMVQRIRSAWNQNQGNKGLCIVKVTIQRDGRLTDVEVERSAGDPVLDRAARSAVVSTRQLPPLPAQYPNPTLGVHLTFEYQ